MDAFGRTDLSGTSKKLLLRLRTKELTLQEFLRECAYWVLKDGFDELMPYSLPTAPDTEAFREYENLPFDRKSKLDSQFFFRNPEILDYYGQVKSVKWRNKYYLDWLQEIKRYLPIDDELSIRRIDGRVLDFQAFFDENPIIVQKVKSTFQAKQVTHHRTTVDRIGESVAGSY